MDTVKSLNKWANRHTSYPIDLLRIALGVFLFFKGISFIGANQDVADAFSPFANSERRKTAATSLRHA